MNDTDKRPRDWRNTALVTLGVAVVFFVGLVIGLFWSGFFDGEPPVAATDTTVAPSPTNPNPVVTTTPSTGQTPPPSTAPAGTQPPNNQIPGQTTVTAVEDTYVDQSAPGEILGFEDSYEIVDDGLIARRALIRFDVAGVPEGESVERALIRINGFLPINAPMTVMRVAGEWSEAETSWASAPQPGDEVATLTNLGPTEGWLELDLGNAVQGNGTVDFYVTTSSSEPLYFSSRENAAAAPTLTVIWGD